MGYPIGWTVYACCAVVVVVAISVAIHERRERRRLQRDLAVARQLPALPRQWSPKPSPEPGSVARLWLFPIVAIVLGLIVAAWSLWNVLD